jgi:hypothetical protein
MTSPATTYPVTYDVQPQLADRNRLTCFFRIILAIPHAILVGGPGLSLGFSVPAGGWGNGGWWWSFGASGVLGTVAWVMAIISWFAILFANTHPKGLRDFAVMYLRWRSKAIAYMALLRDEYPPFGEGDYPVTFTYGEAPATRDKLSVALRIIYLVPHAIVLFFIGIGWVITAVIGWFAILFTGAYPEGFYRFAIGYLRWSLRVEAYGLLLYDQYPPFSLE